MFSGFGVIWRKVVILVHFGDKMIKTRSWRSTTTIDRWAKATIDRHTLCGIDQWGSAHKRYWVSADLKPKSHKNYRITPDEFLPNIYVLCHCSRQHTLSYLLLFIQQNTQSLRLERRSKNSFRALWLELQFIYSILFMQFIYSIVMNCLAMSE